MPQYPPPLGIRALLLGRSRGRRRGDHREGRAGHLGAPVSV